MPTMPLYVVGVVADLEGECPNSELLTPTVFYKTGCIVDGNDSVRWRLDNETREVVLTTFSDTTCTTKRSEKREQCGCHQAENSRWKDVLCDKAPELSDESHPNGRQSDSNQTASDDDDSSVGVVIVVVFVLCLFV